MVALLPVLALREPLVAEGTGRGSLETAPRTGTAARRERADDHRRADTAGDARKTRAALRDVKRAAGTQEGRRIAPPAFDRLQVRAAGPCLAYFRFPQKRWMRVQASSSASVEVA
jgi:hypothetical protein